MSAPQDATFERMDPPQYVGFRKPSGDATLVVIAQLCIDHRCAATRQRRSGDSAVVEFRLRNLWQQPDDSARERLTVADQMRSIATLSSMP